MRFKLNQIQANKVLKESRHPQLRIRTINRSAVGDELRVFYLFNQNEEDIARVAYPDSKLEFR